MACQAHQFRLTLHVDGMPEKRSEKGEVHPQTAREVYQPCPTLGPQSTDECRLVARSLLARALLEGKAGWILQVVHGRPCRHLTAQALPPLHLTQHVGGVDVLPLGK